MQSLFNEDFQFLFRKRWELWCKLPAQIALKHLSLFDIWKGEDGETYWQGDQQVCPEPSCGDNILKPENRYRLPSTRDTSLLASAASQQEVPLLFGQGLGKTVKLIWHWSKCLYGSLSSKGDFIDLPKYFSIIASVKCRNSSFRWVDIRGRNTAWTI